MTLATRNSRSKNQVKYIAAGGLVGGLLLFCLPLYVMAVQGRSEPMKALAPVGGVSLLAGWLAMIFC
jgi:uncharacterized membrane protein YgdD (TMEM256/DUF423 family)